MPLYCQYRHLKLTLVQKTDRTWTVKLARSEKNQALLIHIGDSLLITNKAGDVKDNLVVKAFVPRIHYGGFTRSGYVTV